MKNAYFVRPSGNHSWSGLCLIFLGLCLFTLVFLLNFRPEQPQLVFSILIVVIVQHQTLWCWLRLWIQILIVVVCTFGFYWSKDWADRYVNLCWYLYSSFFFFFPFSSSVAFCLLLPSASPPPFCCPWYELLAHLCRITSHPPHSTTPLPPSLPSPLAVYVGYDL